jgi:hypothetical protein
VAGGLGEDGSLNEDHGHGHHVSRPRVHVHQLHVIVVAEPELLVRRCAQPRRRLMTKLVSRKAALRTRGLTIAKYR